MKNNEFRIGNNLLLTDIKEICTITSISNKYIGYDSLTRTGEAVLECLKPIQITEEWLLKFGFYEFNGWYKKDNLEIYKTTFCFYIPNFSIELNYVHQLQNLYFAITNNEL